MNKLLRLLQMRNEQVNHMSHFAYILECNDGTLYTGYTNDVEKRVHAHNTKKNAASYTRARRPVTLVYTECFETKQEAMKREYALKQLTRLQKLELIHRSVHNP